MASTIQTSRELKTRMESLANALQGRARSASIGAGLTLLVGAVLIAGLGFYFWYGFNVIGSFLSERDAANNIIGVVEDRLTENLEPARKHLEKLVKENAPAWADLASTSVVEGMPAFREHAVTMAIAGMDQSMAESNKHAQDMVATYLRKNEAKIKDAVKRLGGPPKEADDFMTDIKDAFAKEVEVDIDVAVKQISDFIDGFNSLLTKTKSDSVRLTQLQAMQREILMLFKRAMIDHTAGTPVAKR
jgi:hypothetical protein